MSRPPRPPTPRRLLAATLAAAVALLGCPPRGALAPRAGLPEYQERALVAVPGGFVNPMGGSLRMHRVDLVVDTRLGPVEAGAHYDSAAAGWMWSFELRYDGATFLDPTGASHDVAALADGAAIPGTTWVRLDARRLRTKGGLVHVFQEGRLRVIRWASAAWPRLTVQHAEAAGTLRPVAVRQCVAAGDCALVYQLSYDAAGMLAAVSDRAGRVATFVHEGGRLVQARDALDHARGWEGFRYSYDPAGRLTTRTNSEGERVEVGYLDGRVDSVRAPGGGGPGFSFAYESKQEGLYLTRVTDPLGQRTVYRYDGRRRLHAIESEETGERWRTTWSGLRPAAEIAPDGATTRWTWAEDDPVARVDPSGNTVRFTYAPWAEDRRDPTRRPVAEIRDDLGLVERRVYGGAGRLREVYNGEDERTLLQEWRGDGSLLSRTTPDGTRLFGPAGEHGHPLSVEIDGTTFTLRYDAVGNRVAGRLEGPEAPGVVERLYDEDRNLAELVLAPSEETAPLERVVVEHRSDGRRLAVRRPRGGDHEMVYDGAGRLVALRERAEDAWHRTVIERDAAGRARAVERPNGTRQEVDLDALGRPVARRWLRDGAVESEVAFVWEAGRLTQVHDSTYDGPELRGYDAAGRLAVTIFPHGGALFREHDLRSRLVREVFQQGGFERVTERSWDLADREAAIFDDGERIVARSFESGRLARIDTGNGLSRSFTWNAETGAPTGSRTIDANGVLVEETSLDGESPVASLVGGAGILAETTTHVGVQAASREEYVLQPGAPASVGAGIGRRISLFANDGSVMRAYAFDALSRRMDAGHDGFEWGPQRRRLRAASDLESDGARVEYAYDEAGFVVERGGVPLSWTASGRLAAWGNRVAFAWDALERPVTRTIDGVTRRFLFGGRVEADALGNPLSMELGDVRIDLTSGARLYRHRDFRENVKFTTDDAGRVVTHYAYHPYGVDEIHGDDFDPVRFVGGTDLGGLTMIGVRVFDPLSSRFLSPDPVFNLIDDFAYVLGNPVEFHDPEGRFAVLILELIISTGGFAAATYTLVTVGGATTFGVTIAAGAFGLAGLGFALTVAKLGHAFSPEGMVRAVVGGGGSPSSACSPVALAEVPHLPIWPAALWVLSALALVAARRRGPSGLSRRDTHA